MLTLGLLNRYTGCQCCSVKCSSMLKLLCLLIHSLDFQKFQFFNGQKGQAGGTASLCQILSKSLQPRPRYGDISISQDGRRRHVGFLKFQIFNGRKGQEGRSASVCQISSKSLELRPRYGDFSIFKMAAAAILNFQNFNFLRPEQSRGSNCVMTPNFVEIARTAAEISRFFEFSRWRTPPCWIFKISNF